MKGDAMKTRSILALVTNALLLGLCPSAGQAAAIAKKDFNADGRADVVWRNGTTGETYLYPMDARQILAGEGYLRGVADLHWNIAGVGDFDGDGKADLLWRHSATGENYVYFMNGTAIAAEGYVRTVPDTAWKVSGIGDLNNDGRDDILWRNATTGENYIYLLDGLVIAGEGYIRTVSNLAWKVAGVGDTDGDGNADIVWRNVTTGENYLYPMSGTSILGGEGYLRTVSDASWKIAAVGDFNGDGTADLFWRHSVSGQNYLYPLNGRAILGSEGYTRTVADLEWQVAMAADFNNDGRADVLWRNAATGENYLYLMDGTVILPAEGFIRTVDNSSWQVLPASGNPHDATWSASTRISALRNDNGNDMYTPSVALTRQNVGFVAWNEATTCGGRIWVNRNADGVWGTATDIGTTQALEPYVAANAAGDALLVWTEREWGGSGCTGGITGNEVWGNRYSAVSGTWSGAFRISVDAPANSTIYAFSPVATLDDEGRAMVVWIQDTPAYTRSTWYSRYSGSWSAPAILSNGARNTEEPTVQHDAAGNVIAVWRQDTNPFDPGQSGGGPSQANMWSARFDAGAGVWSTPGLIGSADMTGYNFSERPRLAVNANGDAVAIWQEVRNNVTSIVGSRSIAASNTWSTPVALEAGSEHAYWPWVAIDDAGNAQAVWIQRISSAEANESGYTARMNAATGLWSTPELFEQSTNLVSNPKVGMDSAGRTVIAWHQIASGLPPVHAMHYTPGTGLGAQTHLPGSGLSLTVNAAGTALLASEAVSFESTFFGISIRAAMSRP
jgi:hypothetical protein